MSNKLHKLIHLFITINVMVLAFSCSENGDQKKLAITIDSIENRFFKLDFEKNTYEMSDVENYFYTTFPHDDPTQGDVEWGRAVFIHQRPKR